MQNVHEPYYLSKYSLNSMSKGVLDTYFQCLCLEFRALSQGSLRLAVVVAKGQIALKKLRTSMKSVLDHPLIAFKLSSRKSNFQFVCFSRT